jgi:streptomycin 6-kinase
VKNNDIYTVLFILLVFANQMKKRLLLHLSSYYSSLFQGNKKEEILNQVSLYKSHNESSKEVKVEVTDFDHEGVVEGTNGQWYVIKEGTRWRNQY